MQDRMLALAFQPPRLPSLTDLLSLAASFLLVWITIVSQSSVIQGIQWALCSMTMNPDGGHSSTRTLRMIYNEALQPASGPADPLIKRTSSSFGALVAEFSHCSYVHLLTDHPPPSFLLISTVYYTVTDSFILINSIIQSHYKQHVLTRGDAEATAWTLGINYAGAKQSTSSHPSTTSCCSRAKICQ